MLVFFYLSHMSILFIYLLNSCVLINIHLFLSRAGNLPSGARVNTGLSSPGFQLSPVSQSSVLTRNNFCQTIHQNIFTNNKRSYEQITF